MIVAVIVLALLVVLVLTDGGPDADRSSPP